MADNPHSITRPAGFRAAGGTCGIKDSGRPDLALIIADQPARAAAVFTRNAVVGAPVTVGRRHMRGGRLRAFVCNSGISNVATGRRGEEDAIAMCQAAADAVGGDPRNILPCSTGVIGQFLPIEKIVLGIGRLVPQLARGADADAAAANAIMTTDTRPKAAHARVRIAGTPVHVGGIAKGAGMIAPNMATMLGFLTTDADVSATLLRAALKQAVNADASFNRLTIDSDTSTSDTVAIMASGASGAAAIRGPDREHERFVAALTEVCQSLACQIVADGEGVGHVIRVTVSGAASQPDALKVARAIADSPLVKTAVHGRDPNWGRIVMAVGKSPARVDPARLNVKLAGTPVFRNGEPARFTPAAVSRKMAADDVEIAVDLGLGDGRAVVLGADLSREYITINADYHT